MMWCFVCLQTLAELALFIKAFLREYVRLVLSPVAVLPQIGTCCCLHCMFIYFFRNVMACVTGPVQIRSPARRPRHHESRLCVADCVARK